MAADPAGERRAKDLLLIGGVSGSGKNVALAALSDAGYYAVNNLPADVLAATIDYLARAGEMRVAISLDARTGPGLPNLPEHIAAARAAGWNVTFLYLDTKTETLEPSLTTANTVMGSPYYMSPEQVRSLKSIDARADIWALGVILYQLITDRRPFQASSTMPRLTPSARPKSSAQRMTERKERMNVLKIGFAAP